MVELGDGVFPWKSRWPDYPLKVQKAIAVLAVIPEERFQGIRAHLQAMANSAVPLPSLLNCWNSLRRRVTQALGALPSTAG